MGAACTRILPLQEDDTETALLLGSIDFMVDPSVLPKVGVGAIVSVLPEAPDGISAVLKSTGIDEGSDYMLLPLDDISDNYSGLLDDTFWRTLEFIHSRRLEGKNVLVHCDAGVSRSAVIVVAYLMAYGTTLHHRSCMSYTHALRIVQERRERVATEMFDGDLRRLETHLRETGQLGEDDIASPAAGRLIDLCASPGAALSVCSSVLCCPVPRPDTKLVSQLASKPASLRLPLVHGATAVA